MTNQTETLSEMETMNAALEAAVQVIVTISQAKKALNKARLSPEELSYMIGMQENLSTEEREKYAILIHRFNSLWEEIENVVEHIHRQ